MTVLPRPRRRTGHRVRDGRALALLTAGAVTLLAACGSASEATPGAGSEQSAATTSAATAAAPPQPSGIAPSSGGVASDLPAPQPTPGDGTGSATDPVLPAPEDPATVPPTTPAVPPGDGKDTVVTIAGTLSAGVEAGCVLLSGYLLVGTAAADLQPGARVTVTGQVDDALVTTCQQGVPLVVTSVTTG